jgi:hypothetical protein
MGRKKANGAAVAGEDALRDPFLAAYMAGQLAVNGRPTEGGVYKEIVNAARAERAQFARVLAASATTKTTRKRAAAKKSVRGPKSKKTEIR